MREVLKFQELSYASEKINEWYTKRSKFLTIESVPYNTNYIFGDLLLDIIKQGGRILYIWNNNDKDKNLCRKLKTIYPNLISTYFGRDNVEAHIIFVSYKDLIKVKVEYDLVIFDDLAYYSNLSTDNMRELLEILTPIGRRIIFYVMESFIGIGERLQVTMINKDRPYIEPRFIKTRIDLNEDIPYILYEYFRWFTRIKGKVIVYVPSEELVKTSYDYLKKLDINDSVIYKSISNKEVDKISIKNKNKSIFIVTNNINEDISFSKCTFLVMLFADNERYSYKRLVYLCGELGKDRGEPHEVLLVSNCESNNIERAKSIVRDFNKKVWERIFGEL